MTAEASIRVMGKPLPPDLASFMFFATLSSYSFHWFITPVDIPETPRERWLKENRFTHLVMCITGLIGSFYFFFPFREHWITFLLLGVITFLYSAPKLPWKPFRWLRSIAFGKTIFLSAVWTVATFLPVIVEDVKINDKILLFAFSRFLLVYSICILFDLRDRAADKKAGIKSMITYFSTNGVDRLFLLTISLFTICTMLLLHFGYPLPSVCALLMPVIILSVLYEPAKQKPADFMYYFVLDGLMIVSALFLLIGI